MKRGASQDGVGCVGVIKGSNQSLRAWHQRDDAPRPHCSYALTPAVSAAININVHVGDLRIDNFTLPVIIIILFNFALLPLVVFGMDASLGKKAAPAAPPPKGDQAESLALASSPLAAITGATAPGVLPAATPEAPKSFLSDPLIVAGVVVFIFLNGVAKGVLTLSECDERGRRCTGGMLFTTLCCSGDYCKFTIRGASAVLRIVSCLGLARPAASPLAAAESVRR